MKFNFLLARYILLKPVLFLFFLALSWFLLDIFILQERSQERLIKQNLAIENSKLLREVRELERQKLLINNKLPSYNQLNPSWFLPLDRAGLIDSLTKWTEVYAAKDLIMQFSADESLANNLLKQSKFVIKFRTPLDSDFFALIEFLTQEIGDNFLVENCLVERNRFENLALATSLEEPAFSIDCSFNYFYFTPQKFSQESWQ